MADTKRFAMRIGEMMQSGMKDADILERLKTDMPNAPEQWLKEQIRICRTQPDINPMIPRLKLNKVRRVKGKIVE